MPTVVLAIQSTLSEAPDDTGGSAVVVLISAEVVGVHVVALQAPGEVLEEEFVVRAAADVDDQRVVDEAARVQVTNAGHGMHEGPPLPEVGRQAWAGDRVVLRNVARIRCAVEAAGIDHQAEVQESG